MTLANIKPRVRMILLYEYANETDSLVCGTSNKSEILVGYFTKYGDGGVDFQPLGDLYKTQIYQLAKYLKIPAPIIKKPPTAGLWIGQTDEKELHMSYQTLDQILYGLELKIDVGEIQKITHVSKEQVDRIRKMRIKSQHKRRTPLIPKIGVRTPGLDWRSPVQEG
jgi:NAD+ synthase